MDRIHLPDFAYFETFRPTAIQAPARRLAATIIFPISSLTGISRQLLIPARPDIFIAHMVTVCY
jgi:hypothetical protein